MEITKYDESIDIQSFACVIAELLKGKPLLKTEKTQEQLKKIIELFEGLKEEDLSGVPTKKEIANKVRKFKPKPLEQIFQKHQKIYQTFQEKYLFLIQKRELLQWK